MESPAKKGFKRKFDSKDIISELPDEILVHILSFLPTVDAINTMLLRRFANLWAYLPSLSFNDHEIIYDVKELIEEYDDITELGYKGMYEGFASYVRNVLFFNKRSTLDKFDLNINACDWIHVDYNVNKYDNDSNSDYTGDDDDNSDFEEYDPEIERERETLAELRCQALNEINMWIRFVVDREVKELNLHFMMHGVGGSVLPPCVFRSRFLVKLLIHGCGIKGVSRVHMESLKELSLGYVDISNKVFTELISGCPSLCRVNLEKVIDLTEISFTAAVEMLDLTNVYHSCLLDCPNLKALFINGIPPKVVNKSSLREVHIWSLHRVAQADELVKIFRDVEVFNLSRDVSMLSEIENLDLPQTRWKCLQIHSKLHGTQLLDVSKFLRCSPNLEKLVMNSYPCLHKGQDCNILPPEPSPCVMTQLKTVSIKGYKVPCLGLLRFAKFLLKSAISLEKMEIVLGKKSKKLTTDDEVEYVKQLTSFPRASADAKIVIVSNRC